MPPLFQTPILFIIFNRPDTTIQVFNEIKKIRPAKLYIVADGPRTNIKGEKEKCEETRNIISSIDWPCVVSTNYSDTNLGCKKRVSSGITWFFDNEEQGIILEDDCLPNTSFFKFCEEMLHRYKNDEAIGMISGNNFQFGKIINVYSYYFSKYSHIWGWATWKRVWNKYDVNITSWPQRKKEKLLSNVFENKIDAYYWTSIFDEVYNNIIDTWDYQLTYAFFVNNLVSILPATNLVANIGFSKEKSTHTKHKSKFSNMETTELQFPLRHPIEIVKNEESDKITQRNNYPFWKYVFKKTFLKIKS